MNMQILKNPSARATAEFPERHAPLSRPGYRNTKRVLDLAAALIFLILISPIMLAVAVSIKLTSRGPVLFHQMRLGRKGRPFRLFKFRTMVSDAEQRLAAQAELQEKYAASFKIANDPRVTPVGAFLRRTSLDELPQLINVLEGSMSLIGPRPIVPVELEKYGPYGEKLLTVKPGLGGLWQASGRSDTTYDQRIALDMRYVDRASLREDFRLLIKTAVAVLTCRGSF